MQNLKSNLGVWEQICEDEGRWDGCVGDEEGGGGEEEEEDGDGGDDGGIPAVLIAVRELDHENDDFSDIEEEDHDDVVDNE